MKTGVAVSAFAAMPGMPVLCSGARDKDLARVRELSYDGVDLFVREVGSQETRAAVKGLHKYGLGIGTVMPAALAKEGLYLGSREEMVRREAVRRLAEIISFAGEEGAMVSLGLVRGNRNAGEQEAEFFARFLDSCEKLLPSAEKKGVKLLVEPINRYEVNNLNSLAETAAFIKGSQLPLYIMADTFHMNIEDRDLFTAMKDALPLVKHIHFVDSNRLAPSMGHMDLEGMYGLLAEAGYAGYLCLEALPNPDPVVNMEAGARFFRRLTAAHGGI